MLDRTVFQLNEIVNEIKGDCYTVRKTVYMLERTCRRAGRQQAALARAHRHPTNPTHSSERCHPDPDAADQPILIQSGVYGAIPVRSNLTQPGRRTTE